MHILGGVAGTAAFAPLRGLEASVQEPPCAPVAGQRIRWIVPNAPGGGYDAYSRLIAPFYADALGAEISVENVLGAGGAIAAQRIVQAEPDGQTIGILNGAGHLVAVLAGANHIPHPVTDYTLLGRVARSQQVWATSMQSSFQSIHDLFREARERPPVFGTRDVGSVSFVNIAVVSHLLGVPIEIVTGYEGSRAAALAAIRGDVEVIAYNFESILSQIEAGDLRPLMQVSDERIAPHPALEGVPLLGGPNGVAASRATQLGQDVEEAVADAKAAASLIGAGRLIVAPPGMDADLRACLADTLHAVLTDPAFEAAATEANRSLDVSRADEALMDLQATAAKADRFIPIIEAAIREVRG